MEAEERELRRRELDLRRIHRREDLVAELQLDRAAQRGQLALRRTERLQIIERLEDRPLVQRGQRAPIADGGRDEAGEDEAFGSPGLLRAEVWRDELIDEQLREAIAGDIDARGPEHPDLAFVTARYTEIERPAAEVEDEREARRNVGREGRGDRLFH